MIQFFITKLMITHRYNLWRDVSALQHIAICLLYEKTGNPQAGLIMSLAANKKFRLKCLVSVKIAGCSLTKKERSVFCHLQEFG